MDSRIIRFALQRELELGGCLFKSSRFKKDVREIRVTLGIIRLQSQRRFEFNCGGCGVAAIHKNGREIIVSKPGIGVPGDRVPPKCLVVVECSGVLETENTQNKDDSSRK